MGCEREELKAFELDHDLHLIHHQSLSLLYSLINQVLYQLQSKNYAQAGCKISCLRSWYVHEQQSNCNSLLVFLDNTELHDQNYVLSSLIDLFSLEPKLLVKVKTIMTDAVPFSSSDQASSSLLVFCLPAGHMMKFQQCLPRVIVFTFVFIYLHSVFLDQHPHRA